MIERKAETGGTGRDGCADERARPGIQPISGQHAADDNESRNDAGEADQYVDEGEGIHRRNYQRSSPLVEPDRRQIRLSPQSLRLSKEGSCIVGSGRRLRWLRSQSRRRIPGRRTGSSDRLPRTDPSRWIWSRATTSSLVILKTESASIGARA